MQHMSFICYLFAITVIARRGKQ